MPMTIVYSGNQLLEEFSGLSFRQSAFVNDVLKKLATRNIFHDYVKLGRRRNCLVEFDDMGMSYELEIFDFPSDFLDDVEVFDFVSREDFYCHFVIGDLVVGEFHFSECAGAQGGVENVVADSNDSFGHGGLLLKRVF